MTKTISKKAKLISIICLALAVILTAVLLVIFPPKLSAPTLNQDTVVLGEPEYTVLLEWQEIKNAVGYTVEYKYELYPNQTHLRNVRGVSIQVPRIKGKISYRVRALAKWHRADGEFSEWMVYDIAPIKLDTLSDIVGFTHRGNGEYQITKGQWKPVTYTFKDNLKTIALYEMAVVAPDGDADLAFANTRLLYADELQKSFVFNKTGTWLIYIRAVNYKTLNNEIIEFDDPNYDPIELFKLYTVGDWLEIEVPVT